MTPQPDSSADTQPNAQVSAPTKYKIEDVTISVTRNSGALKRPPHRLIVSGAGASTLEHDGKKTALVYAPREIIALLDQLYQVRFTELPARFDVKYSAKQGSDGSINLSMLQMNDAATTSICLNIAAYKKCVTIGSDGPTDLENFAQSALEASSKQAQSQQK